MQMIKTNTLTFYLLHFIIRHVDSCNKMYSELLCFSTLGKVIIDQFSANFSFLKYSIGKLLNIHKRFH